MTASPSRPQQPGPALSEGAGPAAGRLRVFWKLIQEIRPLLGRPVDFQDRFRRILARHRAIGARDRRLLRDWSFTWLRFKEWMDLAANDPDRERLLLMLCSPGVDLDRHLGDLPETERDRIREHRPGQPDPAILRRAFPDVPFAWPQLLHSEIRDFLDPFFSDDDCESRIAALIQRPPAWLRWHPRNPAEPEPPPDHPSLSPSPDLPGAWRIDGAAAPPASEGGYWIPQDISSQAALHFAAPRPGERWLDACAGGGGKYLQLAALTQANPMPDAADVRREALLELIRRSAAVGMKTGSLWLAAPENYRPLIRPEDPLPSGPPGNYDGILVDAPCTGSGTWGRHPFLRHQITAARLRELTELQFNLLQRLAPLVRPGGRILYVVCSVATAECAGVAERFLDTHPDFLPAPLAAASLPDLTANGTLLIPPHRLNGDGFTLALFKRRPE